MTTKICTKCGEAKTTNEFHKCSSRKDGLQTACSTCQKANRNAYNQTLVGKVSKKGLNKRFRESLTVVELTALACVSNARGRSELSSADLYGGLTFTEACAMTEVFVKERLRLEADTGVAHHIDHIIPIAAGGTHTAENLQVLTAEENMAKGAKQ